MRNHLYHTSRDGREVVVTLARDRHNAEFSLQVSYVDDTITPIYASVSDARARGRTLEYFRDVLARIGVRVPDSMFEAVRRDRDPSPLSQVIEHFDDGTTNVTTL